MDLNLVGSTRNSSCAMDHGLQCDNEHTFSKLKLKVESAQSRSSNEIRSLNLL